MVLAALILGLCILAGWVYAASKSPKPRPGFAQIAIVGQTEQSETMQLTATLFDDESRDAWDHKLKTLFEMREARLKFQNERIHMITEEVRKEKEAALAAAGVKIDNKS